MSDYSVSTDGYHVPCLFPIVSQTSNLDENISMVYAFLKSKGASDDEVQDALRYLSRSGVIDYSDEELIEDVEKLSLFKETPCREIIKFLSDTVACCTVCPISQGSNGVYLNGSLEEEFDTLAMLYTRYYAGDRSHIMALGEKKLLVGMFTGSCLTKCSYYRKAEPINYLVAYSLYVHARDNMAISYGCVEELCNGVAAVLHSGRIPNVGEKDMTTIMEDPCVRAFLSPLIDKIRVGNYSMQNVERHMRASDYILPPEFIREHSTPASAIDSVATFLDLSAAAVPPTVNEANEPPVPKVPELVSESADVESAPEIEPEKPVVSSAPDTDTNPEELGAAEQDESIAQDNAPKKTRKSQRAATEDKKAERKQTDNAPTEPVDDEYEEPAKSLDSVKATLRAIGIRKVINGCSIVPLSSCGTPYVSGLCGPDGLVNPYVELSDEVLLPGQIECFSPHALGFILEASEAIAIEYAICNEKEGFLLYLHKDGLFVFISDNDWDYFEAVLAHMRRSLPRKLTLLSAPLYDFVTRMGEHTCRGVISLYDAYRFKMNSPLLSEVAIEEALGKSPTSLTDAMVGYHYRWKVLDVDAALLNDDACVAQVFGYSSYGYRFSGSRYLHLGHDKTGYVVSYADSPKLRTGYFFLSFSISNEGVSLEQLARCYRKVILELGNGRKFAIRDITLVDCAPERGITFVLPYINYAWVHNTIYLWLVRAYKKYVGEGTVAVRESIYSEVKNDKKV